jgi:hypothetical protein
MAVHSAGTPVSVSLAVRFKLTDLDYKPLPRVPVRLVFGSDDNWQNAGAGQRFTTDEKGQHTFTTTVVLDRQMKKKPTNFLDSLVSQPVPMDHLLVAAELEYATYHWLYAIDIFHIPPHGDTLLDHTAIWTRDAKGNFTVEATHDRDGWHFPELGKLVLTAAGYDTENFALRPDDSDSSGTRWTLDLAFKRHPPPIRR